MGLSLLVAPSTCASFAAAVIGSGFFNHLAVAAYISALRDLTGVLGGCRLNGENLVIPPVAHPNFVGLYFVHVLNLAIIEGSRSQGRRSSLPVRSAQMWQCG